MVLTRISFQTAMRAAAVELLSAYRTDAGLRLQIYQARPRSLHPPSAFVDSLRETLTLVGPTLRQRRVEADVLVLHGLFDSAEAAAQRDAFVDGFVDWVIDDYHAAGANTLIHAAAIEDIPTYVSDWLPPEEQRVYYATRITLEGYAEG